MPINTFKTLEQKLTHLKGSERLNPETFAQQVAQAKEGKVRLTEEQLETLYQQFGQCLDANEATGARKYLALTAGLAQKEDGALAVNSFLKILAGADGILQKDEIRSAIEVATDQLIDAGSDEETAAARSRATVLGALGLGAGNSTMHRVERGQIAELAESFGSLLGVCSRLYQDHTRMHLFRTAQAEMSDYAREKAEPYAAAELEQAETFTQIAAALEGSQNLDFKEAVARAAKRVDKAFAPAFTAIAASDEPAAGLEKIDQLRIQIIDADGDQRIDENDVLAMEIGDLTTINVVGNDLAQRLHQTKYMEKAIEMLSDGRGCSKLSFSAGAFHCPKDFFEARGSRLLLRKRRDPDNPFVRKPMSASAALRHILDNAKDYAIDCAAAISVVWYLASYLRVKDACGDEADAEFDKLFPHMCIGTWGAHWSNNMIREGYDVDPETDAAWTGDSRYFKTVDVDIAGVQAGYQGENVVHVKGDTYWGHPMGYSDKDHLIETLNEYRNGVHIEALPALQDAAKDIEQFPTLKRAYSAKLEPLLYSLNVCQENRQELKDFMRTYGREYQRLYNEVIRVRGEHGSHSPEFQRALEVWEDLRKGLSNRDKAIDDLSHQIVADSKPLLKRAEAGLRLMDRDTPEGRALNALFGALKEIQPKNARLYEKGRSMRPIVLEL